MPKGVPVVGRPEGSGRLSWNSNVWTTSSHGDAFTGAPEWDCVFVCVCVSHPFFVIK